MLALLTPDEVADVLRVEVDTLKAWRSRGTGPAFLKVGRSVRYEAAAIDAYLESLKPKSNVTPLRRRAG